MGRRLTSAVLAAFTALMLLISTVTPVRVAAAPKVSRLHPKLAQVKGGNSKQLVDVLVTIDPDAVGTNIAKAVGGKQMKHWKMAQTIQLRVPIDALPELSEIPGVKWVMPNAKVVATGLGANLATVYPKEIGAEALWERSITGAGVTVAVLDTGLTSHPDLPGALRFAVPGFPSSSDKFGHGTAVAGVVAGRSADGTYLGVAPDARMISVKVLGDDGSGTLADVLNGLEWVNQNYRRYNIRVVNLSLTAGVPDSYRQNPINAAVEALWFNGVVVVAASGNRGDVPGAVTTAPGNDPFVITVGAVNDNGTANPLDDTLASFSGRGDTLDGFAKPEVVAPGQGIVSLLAPNAVAAAAAPANIVDNSYLKASGTSLSAPAVAGAAALLLQARPELTPNQVKWLITSSSQSYDGQPDNAGVIDIAAALDLAETLTEVPEANEGLEPADGLISTETGTATDEVYWDQVYWDQVYWDQVYWDQVYWD